jgi:hypothetical protein
MYSHGNKELLRLPYTTPSPEQYLGGVVYALNIEQFRTWLTLFFRPKREDAHQQMSESYKTPRLVKW